MKVELSFEEILALLRKKVSQPIELQYVAADTIAVSATVNVIIVPKKVSLNIRVNKIDGTDILLSYDGGVGIDIILSLVLHIMDGDEKYGALYEKLPNNRLIVHLDKIPEIQSLLAKFILRDIWFVENAAVAQVALR